jgi:hypothetical protein
MDLIMRIFYRKSVLRGFLMCLLLLDIIGMEISAQAPQPHGSLLTFIPASPSAAALGKFGDIPVSYCTGIPNITIPIYNYTNKMNGLNLNISLDYHAGGIRVEEKASNVGIGWALNAGGVITRMMRGIPDETGYWEEGPLPDESGVLAGPPISADPGTPLWELYSNNQDPEPDIFSFNFGGKSGRFVIGKNNQIFIFPQQQIKIQQSYNSGVLAFTIISDDGTTYVFDQQENAQYMSSGGVPVFYGNSWYLSKIISPFGMGEIDFAYNTLYHNYKYKLPQTYFKCDPSTPNGGKQASSMASLGDQGIRSYEALQLQKISFPNGISVNFGYSGTGRCDVPGDYPLNNISITDGTNTRGFKLGQNYSFSSYTGTESNACTGLDETATRLVLHQVQEYSGTLQKAPYVIQYNSNLTFPSTFSYAQDHWGFYNGALDNITLLPPDGKVNFYLDPSQQSPQGPDNADRTSYPNFPAVGTISQLTYPTGGYTTFAFENNDMPLPPQDPSNPTYINEGGYGSVNGTDPVPSFLFTVDKPAAVATTTFTAAFAGQPPPDLSCALNVYITSVDGSVQYWDVILRPGALTQSTTITIPAGQYKCSYTTNTGPCPPDIWNVSLTWNNVVLAPPPSINKDYVGGLRIKTIAEYDGINAAATKVRSYKYLMADRSTSSGVLAVNPLYSYIYADECGIAGGACSTLNGLYNVIASTSFYTLSNSLGSPILYSRVEEDLMGNGSGNMGKTIREYTTSGSQILLPEEGSSPGMGRFPFITPETPDWIYGMLLTDSVFDSNNQLKHTTNNTYTYPFNTLSAATENSYFGGLKIMLASTVYNVGTNGGTTGSSLYMNVNEYFPYSGVSLLANTLEKEYDNQGNIGTKSSSYTYNPTYNYISTIATTTSKGDIEQQRLYYPYDYTAAGATQSLLNANILNSPISREVWRMDAGAGQTYLMTGGEITEYSTFGNLLKPIREHYLTNTQPLDVSVIGSFNAGQLIRNTTWFTPQIQFDQYDGYGNVIQQHKVNDLNHSYVWDYHNTYPICETVNAAITDIAYTSFEADGSGNWVIPDATRNSTISITGNNSYNLNSGNTITKTGLNSGTSYIVSYWSTGGSLNVNGSTATAKTVVGSWTYYEHLVTGASSISVSGTATIDELRLFPKGALMTTYTYTPLYGMTSQCSPMNYISYYNYDGLGRLKVVKDMRGNIIKTFDYHYQGQ